MITYYLTLDLPADDPALRQVIRNRHPTAEPVTVSSQPVLPFVDRSASFLQRLTEPNTDVIVAGPVGYDAKALVNETRSRAQQRGGTLAAVYYDDGSRAEQRLWQYEEEYRLHSRWLDYPPEYVSQQEQAHTERMRAALTALSGLSVELIAIGTDVDPPAAPAKTEPVVRKPPPHPGAVPKKESEWIQATLEGILAEFFRRDRDAVAIPKLVKSLQETGQYKRYWPRLVEAIRRRRLPGYPADYYVEYFANVPLCENTEAEGYKWLDLMVHNVEGLQRTPDYRITDYDCD